MKRLLEGFVETLAVFGLAVVCLGGIGATCVGYLVLCDRYGVLWPSVVLVVLYILCVMLAWAKNRVVVNKREEVRPVGDDSPKPGGGGSVVKLNDETVATAILESRRRHQHTRDDNDAELP